MSEPQVLSSVPVTVPALAGLLSEPVEKQPAQRPSANSTEKLLAGRAVAGQTRLSMDEVHAAVEARMTWLWQGYLAPGNITLLTSQWKTGKTTLLSVLLARLKEGGALAGLPLTRGNAIVISEEGLAHWSQRGRRLGIGNNASFFCRPFRGKPRLEQWLALLDHLSELHDREAIDLLVIDPLAAFLPGRSENNADCMLETLAPLQQLADLGMSVLVMHHPRKGESAAGQAARGSGALTGYVDIIIEMCCTDPLDPSDRRRLLHAWSRYEETPRQLVIELNADGNDYLVHGDFQDAEFTNNWDRLRSVLDDATGKMTRQDILKDWPSEWEPPSEVSLWRWLERAIKQGMVKQDGTGRRHNPFRYWLPGQEKEWQKDPLYLEDLEATDLPLHLRRLSERELFKRAKVELELVERIKESRGV